MMVIMKSGASREEVQRLCRMLEDMGFKTLYHLWIRRRRWWAPWGIKRISLLKL